MSNSDHIKHSLTSEREKVEAEPIPSPRAANQADNHMLISHARPPDTTMGFENKNKATQGPVPNREEGKQDLSLAAKIGHLAKFIEARDSVTNPEDGKKIVATFMKDAAKLNHGPTTDHKAILAALIGAFNLKAG